MRIEHNSRSRVFRMPFGAVCTGTQVSLTLAVAEAGIPNAVTLVVTDKDGEKRFNMPYYYSLGEYCVYGCEITVPDIPQNLWYFFEVENGGGKLWYGNNRKGLGGIGEIYYHVPDRKYQITVYSPEYKTPDWFKNSICYQIFPDRFCNGCPDGEFLGGRQDIIKRGWGEIPYYKAEQFGGEYNCSDFFGGNLAGIEQKLDYLEELGITAIYLNPVFKAFSNHKYDTGDYEEIDPSFGTNEDFERLCKRAKEHGIRIILDGVFNHTGSDSRYFNKNASYDSVGAYQSQQSPYYDWYRFSDWPEEYESWWGMKTLPQVEESNPGYQEYIITAPDAIVKRWLRAGASGWRLDVVDELPDEVVKTMRREIKKTNPDAVIIGEVWEDASNKVAYGIEREYLLGGELDSVMNYPLRSALIDFAVSRTDAQMFAARLESLKENYPPEAFYSLLNVLSTHDVERVLTALGNMSYPISRDEQAAARLEGEQLRIAKKRLFAVMALQMTLPGVPCIYYGDEAGMQGLGDPFCRGCYPWGSEDKEIQNDVRRLIKLRKSSETFCTGALDTVYSYGSGFGMLRSGSEESFLILMNFGYETCMRVDAARFGINRLKGVMHEEELCSDDGIFYINMPEVSVKIFSA